MINILISVNDAYLEKAKTMLFSLKCHTSDDVSVYLLNKSLSPIALNSFSSYLKKKCNITVFPVDISALPLEKFHLGFTNSLSPEIYSRIFAQFLLPQSLDRILWLDADIIIMKDISDFYHQDFEGNSYIVCADSNKDKQWFLDSVKKMNFPKDHIYFNSGVMLANLDELRNGKSLDELIDICTKLQDKITYPDQDLLNYLYMGKLKYSPFKQFNFQTNGHVKISKSDMKNITVLHYNGGKPWLYYKIRPFSKYYWHIRKKMGHPFEHIPVYYFWITKCKIPQFLHRTKCRLSDLKHKILNDR